MILIPSCETSSQPSITCQIKPILPTETSPPESLIRKMTSPPSLSGPPYQKDRKSPYCENSISCAVLAHHISRPHLHAGRCTSRPQHPYAPIRSFSQNVTLLHHTRDGLARLNRCKLVTHTKGLSWGNFETLDLRRDGNGKGQRRLVKEVEEALRQRAAPGCGQCQIVVGKGP